MVFSFLKKKPKISLEYSLFMREGMWDLICRTKGWVHERGRFKGQPNNQRAAEELGYAPQYLSMVSNRKSAATADFLVALAIVMGSERGRWDVPFEIAKNGLEPDPDHQRFNQAKYEGRIPYQRYSISGNLRRKDHQIDFREK